jgi:hypothetical protein
VRLAPRISGLFDDLDPSAGSNAAVSAAVSVRMTASPRGSLSDVTITATVSTTPGQKGGRTLLYRRTSRDRASPRLGSSS